MDYLSTLGEHSERLLEALATGPDAPIPWCGTWTVRDCARHVGGLHHVVGRIVAGRPTTDFGAFGSLEEPGPTDDDLARWVARGTAGLIEQLRSVDPAEPCWTWWPPDRTAGFWRRRVALETVVHRFDVEQAAYGSAVPTDPALAADGVDEYLDLFVARGRRQSSSPASDLTVHFHCLDADGEWVVSFPEAGRRTLRREHAKGDVALRGGAEALLLFLWGRRGVDEAAIEVLGGSEALDRWAALVPAI